jgi:spoIIIJ-associated protein
MSKEVIEIEEKTIDEAIEKACETFGVPREKLNIEILSAESGGFLGLFSKKAKIRASLLELDIDFSFAEESGKKEESAAKAPHKKKPEKMVIQEKQKDQSAERIKKPSEEAAPLNAAQNVVEPSTTAIKAKELLEGMLKFISPEYAASVIETEEKIILSIEGDESGLLIGKRGQNLDAFQYVLNKAVSKIDNDHKMIMIDSGEYRKKREEHLKKLAEKIRDKVKKTNKPVSLSNMNAHDRRIIHLVLQEDESLKTQSSGEGKNRKIVILPVKNNTNRRGRRRRKEKTEN